MKKIFTSVFAVLAATNMMAQMPTTMTFVGKSKATVQSMENSAESDTIKFERAINSNDYVITFPAMKGMETIPSFTVENVGFDINMYTNLVEFSEQAFSTKTINEKGEEKAIEGKISGSYDMAGNKISIKAVFKYGTMPLDLTYTVDAYYVKAVTAAPLYVSVGGNLNYQNESVTYNVRKYKDSDEEKVDVEIPTYTLTGTPMGDLTLGTYTVKGLTYNEEKGGYYRDYANDGLSFHFKSSSADDDYSFNNDNNTVNDILVKYSGTKIEEILNHFHMGKMPFQITSSFKSSATGISSVSTDETVKADGKMYNLSGQQVGDDYKGVVIMNGKKYFKK